MLSITIILLSGTDLSPNHFWATRMPEECSTHVRMSEEYSTASHSLGAIIMYVATIQTIPNNYILDGIQNSEFMYTFTRSATFIALSVRQINN